MTEGAKSYNLRTLRQLMIAAFNTEELRALVRYDDRLSSLAHEFSLADPITVMADKTISWCDRRALIPYLVQLVKQERPDRSIELEPTPTAIEQRAEEVAVESTADQVFICYARQDEDFVLKLAGALKAQGIPVWIDQWDIPGSADWDMAIEEALSKSNHMVVVLSPASMKSGEVRSEWRAALQAGKPIVPVLFQMCDIHRRLQLIQHIDFTSRPPTDATAVGEIVSALGMGKPVPESLTITRPIHLDLVRVPAGEFLMGSDRKRDKHAQDDEFPQHQVYLPEFYIGKYPVTNLHYQAFVQATEHEAPYHWKSGVLPRKIRNHPVTLVSWGDAVAFCTWLSEETGQPFRLPTEAEWEKAARGADGRIWPWGDEPPDESRCNFYGQVGDTTPVGWYSPQGDSPCGCADMAGDVAEWCQSVCRPYPYRAGDGREDLEADGDRVLRGGSFVADQNTVRCAYRDYASPAGCNTIVGFRVARGPLPGAP